MSASLPSVSSCQHMTIPPFPLGQQCQHLADPPTPSFSVCKHLVRPLSKAVWQKKDQDMFVFFNKKTEPNLIVPRWVSIFLYMYFSFRDILRCVCILSFPGQLHTQLPILQQFNNLNCLTSLMWDLVLPPFEG